MRRLFASLFSSLLLLASACTAGISFSLQRAAPANVYNLETKGKRVLLPETEAHEQLAQWVSNNQGGWKPFLATPPARGIIARAPELDLQFLGASVLLHTR